jgi:hypothetical protein
LDVRTLKFGEMYPLGNFDTYISFPLLDGHRRGALAKPAFILLNCMHPSAGSGGIEGVRHMLKRKYGMKTCPPHLCQRSAYAEGIGFTSARTCTPTSNGAS